MYQPPPRGGTTVVIFVTFSFNSVESSKETEIKSSVLCDAAAGQFVDHVTEESL